MILFGGCFEWNSITNEIVEVDSVDANMNFSLMFFRQENLYHFFYQIQLEFYESAETFQTLIDNMLEIH